MPAPPDRPGPAAPPDRPALATASVLLVLAAFAFSCVVFGAVEVWARSVVAVLALLAFLAMAAAGRLHPVPGQAGDGRFRLLLPETLLLALLAFTALHLVPLPPGLHRALSPEAARLLDRGLPPGETHGWRALSVCPFATRVELLHLAALSLVFSLLARGLRGRGEARMALGGLTALGALAAVLGIVDLAAGGTLLDYYPREARFPGRLAGLLVNPNHFAGMMAMAALAALGLHLSLAADGAGEGEAPLRALVGRGIRAGAGRGRTAALLLALAACTAALLLTASRLGSFSFVAGLALFAALLARNPRPGRTLAALGAVVGLLLAVNAVAALDPLRERWSLFFGGAEGAEGRVRAWTAAAAMGARFPVAGSGPGTFGWIFPAYQPPDLPGTWDHAHNDFVEWFCDGGLAAVLLGAALAASFAARTGRAALRGDLAGRALAAGVLAAAAAAAVHAVGDFGLRVPGNSLLLAALLGIGWAAARSRGSRGG